ncbi:hydrogenase nickel incorporation protein HypA [Lachnospiraceae bacterium oral taxon 500]|nr:hydrogenase nickel incorporation protein HypA [Lachnospiraceae bacterium oral taxon 500]
MHELGIVFEIAKRVGGIAAEYDIAPEDIAAVVVEIGEASTIIPRYLRECWPAAIDRTEFEHVELQTEVITATVSCKACQTVYEYLKNDRKCPRCGLEEAVMITGREFQIKEILLFEDDDESEEV